MKRLKEVLVTTALFFSLTLWSQKEYLVIFTQDTAISYADKDFVENYLGRVKDFAEEDEIDLIVRDIKQGVFEKIAFTPSIYFMNDINSSLYVGRYTEFNRLKNFVRSARSIRRNNKPVLHKNAFFSMEDKMAYTYPIKVTAVKGKCKRKGCKKDLHEELLSYVYKDFNKLTFEKERKHPAFGRKYYMDFYPYVEVKTLYINASAFSEFNCKEPIYTQSILVVGPIKEAKTLMIQSISLMLEAIEEERLKGISNGDAHSLFPKNTKIITPEEIGIKIEKKAPPLDIPFPNEIPQKWKFKGPVNSKTPVLQFSVPSSIYTGEMKGFTAQLDLKTMQGSSKVDMNTLSMGAKSLNSSVIDRILVAKFPESSIKFKRILKAPENGISGFIDHEFLVKCDFTFVGKTIERDIVITFTPFMDGDELLIQCQAQFDIRLLESFGIESGVGDNLPDHDTVKFYLNFIMQSKVQ